MRALIYSTNKAAWGGSEIVWKDICLELKKHNIDVMASAFFHSTKEIHFQDLENFKIPVQERKINDYPYSGSIIKLLKDYLFLKKESFSNPYWKEINQFDPEVMIINAGEAFENELLHLNNVILQATLAKKTIFIIVHFSLDQIKQLSKKEFEGYSKLYSLATKVFFVSKENMNTVKRVLGLSSQNFTLLTGQVKTNQVEFKPVNSNTLKLNLAVVARLEHEIKGQDITLEYLSNYSRKDEIVLNIYGQGRSKKYLEELVAFYNISRHVTFKGYEENKTKIWEENEMLLSFSKAEGLPLSLLEAMAYGRSFISASVGGVKNLPSSLGYTFDPTNRDYFYSVLNDLLDNREMIVGKGEKCHNWSKNQSLKSFHSQFFNS